MVVSNDDVDHRQYDEVKIYFCDNVMPDTITSLDM